MPDVVYVLLHGFFVITIGGASWMVSLPRVYYRAQATDAHAYRIWTTNENASTDIGTLSGATDWTITSNYQLSGQSKANNTPPVNYQLGDIVLPPNATPKEGIAYTITLPIPYSIERIQTIKAPAGSSYVEGSSVTAPNPVYGLYALRYQLPGTGTGRCLTWHIYNESPNPITPGYPSDAHQQMLQDALFKLFPSLDLIQVDAHGSMAAATDYTIKDTSGPNPCTTITLAQQNTLRGEPLKPDKLGGGGTGPADHSNCELHFFTCTDENLNCSYGVNSNGKRGAGTRAPSKSDAKSKGEAKGKSSSDRKDHHQ